MTNIDEEKVNEMCTIEYILTNVKRDVTQTNLIQIAVLDYSLQHFSLFY